MRAKLSFAKFASIFIVILILVAFQGGAAGWASQKVTVLQLSGVKSQQIDPLLHSIQYAGYEASLQKGLGQDLGDAPVVILLPAKLDDKTLTSLRSAASNGSKLVLLPAPDAYPDQNTTRLFQTIGIQLAGSVFASRPMAFHWKDDPAGTGEKLHAGSRVLSLPASPALKVLATWDRDYPALVVSDKGALINWQLGRQLSGKTNEKALQLALTQLGADSVASKKSEEASSKPATVFNAEPQPAQSQKSNPVQKAVAQAVPAKQPATTGNAAEEPSGGDLKEALEAAATGEKPQTPFSFLDASAADLAPKFDYGVYSMNMRWWDDYNRRVNDAIEASRQLNIELPEKKIQALQEQSRVYKKEFESLYLAEKTVEGLEAFGNAKTHMLEALALTSLSPKTEGRAIWLDRGTIVDSANPEGLRKVMRKLHDAGINIVYFETINAGYPVYPSKIVPQNPLTKGWDPLKVAIEEGHSLGMEVHAWVWTFAVGNKRHNDVIGMPDHYVGPVLSLPELQDDALKSASGGYQPDSKQHEFWLSPASPEAREFLLNSFEEVVRNYDVDGLHLDYIRYPFQGMSTAMGYEPVGRSAFFNATGTSLDGLDDYKRKLWIAWKTYQVSSFVQQTSTRMRGIKPDIKISAAVFPMKRESRIVAIQQDWETWVDNGWVDILSPMSYTSEPSRLQSIYETVANSPQKHVLIYPGIAIKNLGPGELSLHLEAIREKGGLGATLFAGAHLDDAKALALGTGPFKEKKSLPPHKDPVKALQLLLEDCQAKFHNVATHQPGTIPAPVRTGLERDMDHLDATLKGMRYGALRLDSVQKAQQDFETLKASMAGWLSSDRVSHPFRAQYFDQSVLLMNRLLGYLSDKVSWNQMPVADSQPQESHAASVVP